MFWILGGIMLVTVLISIPVIPKIGKAFFHSTKLINLMLF